MLNCLLQNYSSSVLSRWSQHSSRTELRRELNCLMRKYFNVENFLFTFHNCNCSSALEYFPTTLVQHRFIGNFSSFPTFNLFHSDLDNLFQNHLSIKEVKWYLICFMRTMALVASNKERSAIWWQKNDSHRSLPSLMKMILRYKEALMIVNAFTWPGWE